GTPRPEVTICIHSQAVDAARSDHHDARGGILELNPRRRPLIAARCPNAELTAPVIAPRPEGATAIDGEGVKRARSNARDSRVRREVFELRRCVALRVGAKDAELPMVIEPPAPDIALTVQRETLVAASGDGRDLRALGERDWRRIRHAGLVAAEPELTEAIIPPRPDETAVVAREAVVVTRRDGPNR